MRVGRVTCDVGLAAAVVAKWHVAPQPSYVRASADGLGLMGGVRASGEERGGYENEALDSLRGVPGGVDMPNSVSGYCMRVLAVVRLPTRPVTARRLRITSTLFSARRSALGSQSPSGRFRLVKTYSSGSTSGRAVIASSSRAIMCRQK